jgi:hypothetical protein
MVMDVQITGAADLKRVTKQIRSVANPKQVKRDMLAGLRTGATPGARAVKAAAAGLPAKGPSTGLRADLAAATGIQVRTTGDTAGVKVRISRARMGDRAALARVTNNGRWRHQVFPRPGHRTVFVTQTSRKGWFDTAVARAGNGVRRELQKVIDGVEKRLSHN